MRRPSQEKYDRALAAYRANASPEEIARAAGLDVAVVDRLTHEGFPARGGRRPLPELRSFESLVIDRLHRTRVAELDWAQTNAETAAKTAAIRKANVEAAAKIEQAILMAWSWRVAAKMKGASQANAPALDDLCAPREVLAALRTLRWVRDQAADVRAAELFRFLKGDEDAAAGSEWDALADLAELTDEEQEHYAKTGQMPKPQLELKLAE